MELNPELIREILFAIEQSTEPCDRNSMNISAENKELNYHLGLLYDNGYIKGVKVETLSGDEYIDLNMTLLGHNFLDQIRNDNVWQNIIDQASTATRQITFASLQAIAVKAATLNF